MKIELSLRRAALLLWCAGLPMAAGDDSPPIQIIMDLHMDPMNAIPLQMRPQVYQNWRDAATWYMDASDARGAKLTFLSVGEYMEYTLADPADVWLDALRLEWRSREAVRRWGEPESVGERCSSVA